MILFQNIFDDAFRFLTSDISSLKFLALVIPAMFTVAFIFLNPLLEKQKFKNQLLNKSITVIVNFKEEHNSNESEYLTEGIIDKITNDTIEIKRKTKTLFRVPLNTDNISIGSESNYNSDFTIFFTLNNKKELDKNKGILVT
ncbi:hypothetical protein BTO06_12060 [Tenacibaculum sp. SZ-18]|uniref:hypothetical protein n=1 Tax=Tenacibaculum sp. SZ-18 TaxID=754423 RepID=UPI000C2D07FF|nr:hypothetical protein [Tenacibaculum sp. SZ-18]AUC15838.1 hypothetical protein BTO06_12060 [Tenacibaculum sp. SZ-18]